ncbi:MAG: glycerol-3-phosphate 1-O-acyltransferase PlsY [Ktedonobacterales bacterium]
MSIGEVTLRFVLAAVAGYLLGSLPSGVLVGRLFGNVDVRTQGSGKTGATNVLRTLGKGPALLVALLDVAKGAGAVLLARFVIFPAAGPHVALDMQNLSAVAQALAGLAALLGHNYSLFIHFSGGRGVATGAGALLAMTPLAMLVGIVAMIVPIALTRYVSLGSIVAAAVAGLTALLLTLTGHGLWPQAVFALAGASFIILSHRDNIGRLLHGTERKLGSHTA